MTGEECTGRGTNRKQASSIKTYLQISFTAYCVAINKKEHGFSSLSLSPDRIRIPTHQQRAGRFLTTENRPRGSISHTPVETQVESSTGQLLARSRQPTLAGRPPREPSSGDRKGGETSCTSGDALLDTWRPLFYVKSDLDTKANITELWGSPPQGMAKLEL